MTTQIIRGTEVNRPQPDAIPSSVLDHATVESSSSFGLRNNEGLWPSYNCIDTLVPTPICPDPIVLHDFQVAGWVPGFEFAVSGGVQCSTVGLDTDDQRAELERVFARNEGKGVEQALLANRFATPGSDDLWDAPVDLTSGGAVPLNAAIGYLESYAATVYAGVPTLHMPRSALLVAYGMGLVKEVDGKFYTKTGSKIAAGGGYDLPNGSLPSQNVELYVTGEVYVERSETLSHHSWVVPGDGNSPDSDGTGLSGNTVIGLVQRLYRVGVDCFVAQAEGTLWRTST